MLQIDYTTALIATTAGGFRAVVITDFIQGLLILFGGVSLFVALLWKLGGMSGEALFEFGKLGQPPELRENFG